MADEIDTGLTEEEEQKVRRNRLRQKPLIYIPETKVYSSISDDMEAYLILLDASTKDQVVALLEESRKTVSQKSDADTLRALLIKNEGILADERIVDFDTKTSTIESFLPKLNQTLQPDELGSLKTTIQAPTALQLFNKSRMTHLKTFLANFALMKFEGDPLVVDSWIEAIAQYRGVK